MEYSGGIILYRNRGSEREFFLAHPGGVYYRTLEKGGYWGFPKGNIENTDWYRFPYSVTGKPEIDAALYAAIREYHEETGDNTDLKPLLNNIEYVGKVLQRKSKTVYAFSLKCDWDLDPNKCYSNIIEVVVDDKKVEIPENDSFMWATYSELKDIVHPKHLFLYKKQLI
jgi:predicted NUDIX family NTP pyrophosphohydrolase